jgi:O-antigen/teichoic acid export membrane protein
MISSRRALLWSFAERYVNVGVSLASTMIVARLLTPGEVGIYSLCAAVTLVASTLRDFGISDYLIQAKNLDRARLRAAFGVALVVAWSVGGLIFLARFAIAGYFSEPAVASVLAVLCIGFVLLPFTSPAFALLNREMQFRKIFVVQVVSTVCGALTAITLAWLGHGPLSLAWASVAGIAANCVVVGFLRPRDSWLLPGLQGAREIVRFGGFHVLSRMIDTGANTAHEYIIARAFGFTQLGIFSRAKGAVDLFNSNVTSAINRVALPMMADAHRQNTSLTYTFARATSVYSSVAWPFFVFMSICAPEVIDLLFGKQWRESGPIASVLALAMLPSVLYALSSSVLGARGEVKRRFWISVQWAAVHLAMLAIFSRQGFQAMAWAWLVTNCSLALIFTVQLKRVLKTSALSLYGRSGLSIPITACTGTVQYGTAQALRSAGFDSVWIVLCALIAGGAAWLLAVHALKAPVAEELDRLRGNLRRHRRAPSP